MDTRLFAFIKQIKQISSTRHFQGLPPELTKGQDYRHELPKPTLLIIDEKPEGIFLLRFTIEGDFAGDTWHQSIDEAKQQAEWEYGDGLSDWIQIPSDIDDFVSFALAQIP